MKSLSGLKLRWSWVGNGDKNYVNKFGRLKTIVYICAVKEILERINRTLGGYEVKDLRYKPLDRLIVGFVKCPIWGKEILNSGYVSVVWRTNGNVIERYGGRDRQDLNLKIERYETEKKVIV